MNTQIILSILVGIIIGGGAVLLVSRTYIQKITQQFLEQSDNSSAVIQHQSKFKPNLLQRKSFLTTIIIIGIVMITLTLLAPTGAEADDSHPANSTISRDGEFANFLFQYPGGWLTSGSDIYFDAGNVGINSANPTERLHVEGNLKLNGNITSDGDICIGTCN